jgi:hypothetical protein
MLQVTTPAESHDLTTLAAVKRELGIVDRAEDENLTAWIARASAAIAEHCNRVFLQETITETFRPSSRSETLLLSRFPVDTIESITESEVALESGLYELDAKCGIVERLTAFGSATSWPAAVISVTYTAGYEDIDALPREVEGAAIALVRQYRFAAQRDPQLRSENLDGVGAASYFDGLGASGLSPEITGLLAKHVNPIAG